MIQLSCANNFFRNSVLNVYWNFATFNLTRDKRNVEGSVAFVLFGPAQTIKHMSVSFGKIRAPVL